MQFRSYNNQSIKLHMNKIQKNGGAVDNGQFLNLKDEGIEIMVDTDVNFAKFKDSKASDYNAVTATQI